MYIRLLTVALTTIRAALVNAYHNRAVRKQRTATTMREAARHLELSAEAADIEAARCTAEAAKL